MVGITTVVSSIDSRQCFIDSREHSALYKINTNVEYMYSSHTTTSQTNTFLSFLFCLFAQFCFLYLSAYGFHRTNSDKHNILHSLFQRERERVVLLR